jgi:hypothetical protein
MKILSATKIAIEKSGVLKSAHFSIGDFPRLEVCSLFIELTFLSYAIYHDDLIFINIPRGDIHAQALSIHGDWRRHAGAGLRDGNPCG